MSTAVLIRARTPDVSKQPLGKEREAIGKQLLKEQAAIEDFRRRHPDFEVITNPVPRNPGLVTTNSPSETPVVEEAAKEVKEKAKKVKEKASGRVAKARKSVSRRGRRSGRWIRQSWRKFSGGFRRYLRRTRKGMRRGFSWTGQKVRRGFMWTVAGLASVNMFAGKYMAWLTTPSSWLFENTSNLLMRGVGRLLLWRNKNSRWGNKMMQRFRYRTFSQIYADQVYGLIPLAMTVSWLIQPFTGHRAHVARKDKMYLEVINNDPEHKARKRFKFVSEEELERRAAKQAAKQAEQEEAERAEREAKTRAMHAETSAPGMTMEESLAAMKDRQPWEAPGKPIYPPSDVLITFHEDDSEEDEREFFSSSHVEVFPRTEIPGTSEEMRFGHVKNYEFVNEDSHGRFWASPQQGKVIVVTDEPLVLPEPQPEEDLHTHEVVTEQVKAASKAEKQESTQTGESAGSVITETEEPKTQAPAITLEDSDEYAAARNWGRVRDKGRKSYLFGSWAAYTAYNEDPEFVLQERLISAVRTQVNNETQSPRSGYDHAKVIQGFNETIALIREKLGQS